MKKLLFTLLALAGTSTAFAQVEIGLKLSPSITSLRADGPSDNKFENGDGKLSLGGGLLVDYFFGENYAFSTGLFLTGRGGTFTYVEGTIPFQQKIAIQYLELPATVKLFTNEVSPGTRVYFQLGGALAVPVGTRINGEKRYVDPTNQETKASDHVKFIDANVLVGAGAEYQLGSNTKIFAGLSYHRGLVNIDSYFDDERNTKIKDVTIKNSEVALDLGIKF
ncbi:porin family protein [uncultured Hymenobacter sp.]|uniref:porin family protein n=1 Tax=uncultured Hymenobacter sp. TaxID=170016 RepID=UPI0035C9B539